MCNGGGMTEQWKDVPGYEGRYQVSDMGRVRSVDRLVRFVDKSGVERQRRARGQILRPGKCRDYLIVNLSGDGTIAVHILVARAWVPGWVEGLEVNHKDGIKANCVANNLEWVTKRENQEHAVTLGLRSQAVKVRCPDTGTIYESIARAARLTQSDAMRISSTWERI